MQRKHLINLTIFNDKNLQQTRNILLLFSCSVLSDSLWPQVLQHARLSCPPLSLGVCSDSCPLSWWWYLCHSLFLLSSIFPSIRVSSNELVLGIWWPKYWSFSFSIIPSNEYSGLISLGLTGLTFLQSKGLSRVFSSKIWKHQFFSAQPSLWSNSHIRIWPQEKP